MVNIPRSWLSSSLLFSLLISQASSLVFEDAEAPDSVNLLGRSVQSSDDDGLSFFDRLSRDSYYWTGTQNGHKTLANLTVDVGDDEANIVSMERFRHLLESVDCTKNGMVMEFKDSRAFGYTQRGWQWVNDEDDRQLVLIAGSKHCGWNAHRTPFLVSSIVFDKPSLTAKLSGKATEWKKLFRNFELTVGNVQEPSGSSRRDWDPEASMSFNHQIPLSKSIPVSGVSVDISCDGCATKGSFDFGAHIKASDYGVPSEASLTLSPNGVSATFTPRLQLSGELSKNITGEHRLLTVPVDGISIPGGVLDLGPEIVFSFGYQFGPVQGSAGITAGVTVSLSDSAEFEVNLVDPDMSAGGWTPQLQAEPVKVDAKIEAGAEIYTKAEIQLSASLLDYGFEAGVNLKPYLGATISASSEGEVGVDLDVAGVGADVGLSGGSKACVEPRAGISLNADVAKADNPGDPIINKQLAEITAPVESKCFDFGPSGSIGLGGASSTPSSSGMPSSSSIRVSTPLVTSSSFVHSPTVPSSPAYASSSPTSSSAGSSSSPSPSTTRASHFYHHRRGHYRHGVLGGH